MTDSRSGERAAVAVEHVLQLRIGDELQALGIVNAVLLADPGALDANCSLEGVLVSRDG